MKNRIYGSKGSYATTFYKIRTASDLITAEKIADEAYILYQKLLSKNRLGGIAQMHWKQCCERAALYLIIKEYYPTTAYEWIELSTKAYGEKTGATINKSLHIPGMKNAFLPIMKFIAGKIFGEKGGFQNNFVSYSKTEARFDILECPYCKYLSELGCPELIASFCQSDEYAYGNLEFFTFERKQTLGTGGTKCDFCIKKK